MPLKVNDLINIMEKYAPVKFMESYDNVGLMVGDRECEVTKILIALDCTLKVIDEAIAKGCNLIITHHPLLFRKPKNITTDTLHGKKLIKLINNNINVYSSHTNLDSVPNGINEIIMKLLGFNESEIIETSCEAFEAGLGRIGILEEAKSLEELIKQVKNSLNVGTIRYCGDENKMLRKIAVINGSGQDYISKAIAKGAECIITGDTTYHYISDYNEEGISIIDAGHFDTEWPAMKIVSENIEKEIKFLGLNNMVLLSEFTVNPYKFK